MGCSGVDRLDSSHAVSDEEDSWAVVLLCPIEPGVEVESAVVDEFECCAPLLSDQSIVASGVDSECVCARVGDGVFEVFEDTWLVEVAGGSMYEDDEVGRPRVGLLGAWARLVEETIEADVVLCASVDE